MKTDRQTVTGIIFTIALFLLLSTLCFIALRVTLLSNAEDLASSLATGYAYDIESRNRTYDSLLTFASGSLDERISSGWDDETVIQWSTRFFREVNDVLGQESAETYMIYKGRYISQDGLEEDDSTDYTSRPWYELTEWTTYSDIYNDIFTGRPVVTMSRKCHSSDTVVAIDIKLDALDFTSSIKDLKEGTSLFLLDKNGDVILFESNWESSMITDEELSAFAHSIREHIDSSMFEFTAEGMDGRKRLYSATVMENGWAAVVAMPYSVILSDLNMLGLIFGIFFFIGLVIVFIYLLRDSRYRSQMERVSQTVSIISNLYYALYRINYVEGTYEMIKGSPEVRAAIKRTGHLEDFMDAVSTLIKPEDLTVFNETLSRERMSEIVSTKAADFGGYVRRLFDGVYKYVSVRIVYDEGLKDEVILCFRVTDDEIQKARRDQLLLETALESAKKSEKAKEAFFSSMSHDMRTPVNAITGLTELALRSTDNPVKTEDYLKKIKTSSSQLTALVNDILEMSRLETGRVVLNAQTTDIVDTVSACIEPFSDLCGKEGKKLTVSYDIEDSMVLADSFRITQILNNLLSNAIKFTSPGTGKIDVSVREYKNNSPVCQYVFTVTDNGIGMSENFLNHIFEPYARETSFTPHYINGTGLGMPIVKSLVIQMSGQIQVHSTLKEGTTFTVTIPMELAQEGKKKESEKVKAGYSLRDKHILIAEDNPVNMEIAVAMLEDEGAIITQAFNGQEAYEEYLKSEEGLFDAVLLDMQMPVMDGCEAARAIRDSGRADCLTIPLIAVTANAFAEDVARTREAGMDAHVSKPIDFNVLCKTIDKLTGEKEK